MSNEKERNYYTLSEMVNKTGIKRQIFQDWRKDELRLLIPLNDEEIKEKAVINGRNEAENNGAKQVRVPNWKYSKESLGKVYIIEMLHDLGYKYKEIKYCFDNGIEPALKDAQEKIDQKIKDLTNKKTYLDHILESSQYFDELPEILKKYYFTKYYKMLFDGKSTSFKSEAEYISPLINKNKEKNISSKTFAMINLLIPMLLSMKNEPKDSEYVKECTEAIFKVLIDESLSLDASLAEDNDTLIYLRYYFTRMYYLLYSNYSKFEDLAESYSHLCDWFGESSFVFVQEVFDKYSNRLKKEYQDLIDSYGELDEEEIMNDLHETYSTNNAR